MEDGNLQTQPEGSTTQPQPTYTASDYTASAMITFYCIIQLFIATRGKEYLDLYPILGELEITLSELIKHYSIERQSLPEITLTPGVLQHSQLINYIKAQEWIVKIHHDTPPIISKLLTKLRQLIRSL